MADCPSCKRETPTFEQEYSTFPLPETPVVSRWKDLVCALCGTLITRVAIETPLQQ